MRRLSYAILVCMSACELYNSGWISIAWSSYTTDNLAAFSAFSNHVASTGAYFATREATRSLWLVVQLRRGEALAIFGQVSRRFW